MILTRALRRPGVVFAAIVLALVSSAFVFVQSRTFARVLKSIAARHMPAGVGIEAEFSELKVKFIPPGLSVRDPDIRLAEKNALGIPGGARIRAKSAELEFKFFQALTGNISVQRVLLANGSIELGVDLEQARRGKREKRRLDWNSLLQIRAESVALSEVELKAVLRNPSMRVAFLAREASISRKSGMVGSDYSFATDLKQVSVEWPSGWRAPRSADSLVADGALGPGGARIARLELARGTVSLFAAGSISGDLLDPDGELGAKGEVAFEGELAEAVSVFGADLGLPSWLLGQVAGRAIAKGTASADLARVGETLRASASIGLKGARFREWTAESVEAEADWEGGQPGGEARVRRLVVSAPAREKDLGRAPAHGGRVAFDPFRFSLSALRAVEATARLERAHLQWFTAPALEKVYALDLVADGSAALKLSLPRGERPWSLDARVDLKIDRLQLDNQKQGKAKPLFRVLDVAGIRAVGGVIVDSNGLRPDQLVVTLGRSRVEASGRVDFEKGFDLHASASLSLADAGKLAELEIRGEGRVDAHVHGPIERVIVDFDVDIHDAYYVGLALGDLRGRITFDEDPRHLFLRNIQVAKGGTRYSGGGILDVGDAETISLDISCPRVQLQEVNDVFRDLTKDIGWYPRGMTGTGSGEVRIRGGLSKDRLEVQAELAGTQFQYLGEKFRTVAATGGYERGRFYLDELVARKQDGKLGASISFDRSADRIEWSIATESMTLSDLDLFARLDVPIRGLLSIESHGRGKFGAIESTTRASLGEVTVRSAPFAASELELKSSGGITRIKGSALGGQGLLEGAYDFSKGKPSYLRAVARSLDFSPILLLLNPKSIQEQDLKGLVSGGVDISFQTGAMDLAIGKFWLDDYLLTRGRTRFQLGEPVSVRLARGSFHLPELRLRGRTGEVRLRLDARDTVLDGEVSGELDLGIIEILTPVVARATGFATLDYAIGGTIRSPVINGKASVAGAEILSPSLESPVENITGVFHLRQNVVSASGIEGDLAGGRLIGGGTVTLYPDRYPELALTTQVSGAKVKFYPFQWLKVRGKIKVSGSEIPYLIDGSIQVDSAFSRESLLSAGGRRSIRTALYLPPPRSKQESDFPKFKLTIHVESDGGIIVKNDLFDAELKARVTVVNTIDNPRIVGLAEMVHGKMLFKENVFNVKSAVVHFDNPAVFNPRFNLTAATEVGEVKVNLYAAGKMDSYKVELGSTPSLPEAEILSLLALGITSEDRRRLRAGDRAAVEQSEGLSLLLHSLDFNRDVHEKTGFKVELRESTSAEEGSSVFKAGADAASAPKIVIKRQIFKNVDVSVGSTVGVGSKDKREVNAEYKVSPGFSVIGVWDILDQGDTTAKSSKGSQTSYGFDLQLEKRFK